MVRHSSCDLGGFAINLAAVLYLPLAKHLVGLRGRH